jgi:HAD superfamily hydrolase (TIGR01509 family)
MRRPRAILFDHDGVLVASEPLHWMAWEKLLAELKIPYDNPEMRSYVGRTAPEIMAKLLDRHRPGWDASQFDIHALARRKNDYYLAAAESELQPYPGVREGLQWLRDSGIRAAVVSNAKRRELEAALGQLQLADYFDQIISRDDVPAPKPDPSPYLQGAALLGFRPADCVAIEDSPPGLEAALRAEVPAAAVMTNFTREKLERPVPARPDLQPSWIGPSIVEFFDWLRSLPA